MSSPADVIRLDHVSKQFGDFVAVYEADFAIRSGEFFSMLGPSGCGKTTLLRMIAGFEEPTSGRILLDGADQAGVPPYKRQVNTVFQQYALFPHMSVVDNVAFGLRSRNVPEADVRQRVSTMLETVRLGDYAKRRPSQLSGGQQQRVALARALVNLPSALLLDEPLAALDLKLRQAMQIELKRIQREVGITFVFVTHDQEEALTMSDRIAVMSQGRVEQIGTPAEIYNTPATVFVAGFIGSANLLPGTLVEGSATESVVELTNGQRIRGDDTECRPGDPVTVMLRPERLLPSVEEPRSADHLRGTVSDVIFQGAASRVLVRLPDGTEIIASVEAEDRLPFLRPGDDLYVGWDPEAAYVLRGWPAHAGATTTDVDVVQASLEGRSGLKSALLGSGESHRRVSRRAVLIGGAVVGAAAVGGIIAAIASGGDGSSSAPTTGVSASTTDASTTTRAATTIAPTTAASTIPAETAIPAETTTVPPEPPPPTPVPGSTLRILTWPLYIEHDDPLTSPTLKSFAAATQVKVDYKAEFDDNDAVYTKYGPDLKRGHNIGFDIIVPTAWMAAKMINEGMALKLDPGGVPNKRNIRADLASPSWDPGREYSLPWAQGQTGMAYFPKKTRRPITSISDLLDPAFKNRVSLLTEWRDTIGLFLLDAGVSPADATMDQIRATIEVIGKARDAGQFRKIQGNVYTDDLITGEVWLAIAWSGDIASLKAGDTPDIEYVLPDKGAMSFVDTMIIANGAANKAAAEAFMNYVYDPKVSGPLFESITNVSPVQGAAQYMTPAGQADPFVNPPAGSKLYEFREVSADEAAEIDDLFTKATQL